MENFEYEAIIGSSCESLEITFKTNHKIYETKFSIELLNDTDESTNSLDFYQDLVHLKNAKRVFEYILKYHSDAKEVIPFYTSEKNKKLCKKFFFEE